MVCVPLGTGRVPASQTWPWGEAGPGPGYVVAEKSIKNKSSESAPGAMAVGRRRETVFEVLFLVPVSRRAFPV